MTNSHSEAIASVEQSIKSSVALRASLEEGEEIGRKMIAQLRSGTPISTTIESLGLNVSALREVAADHLRDYEQDRHQMRMVFIGAALDEGFSISEIARKLGVARQLIQRYAHELRGGEHPEETSANRRGSTFP